MRASQVIEGDVQDALTREADKHAWLLCWKLSTPGRRGVPDRVLLAPPGRMLFVELKKPGKTLSPMQAVVVQIMRAFGFKVEVVDNKKRAVEVVRLFVKGLLS